MFRGKRRRVKGEVGVFTKGSRQLTDGQGKFFTLVTRKKEKREAGMTGQFK